MHGSALKVTVVDDTLQMGEIIRGALGLHGIQCVSVSPAAGSRDDGDGRHLTVWITPTFPAGRETPRPVRGESAFGLSAADLGLHPLRQALLQSIFALVHAVEAKDPYTRRHSEQVMHYALHLGRYLGVGEEMLQSIHVAALLHDVGKIGVPDGILTKPGPLTEAEYDHIRRHPALGSDIVANIPIFAHEARLIRHHHEWWDGMGYPDGLCGSDIPLASRVIQLADCIDAMLMPRVYKAAYPIEKVLQELQAGAGTQFDPNLAPRAAAWCRSNPHLLLLPKNAAAA